MALAFAPLGVARSQNGSGDVPESTVYLGRLMSFFRRDWAVPASIPPEELDALATTVTIAIGTDGAITGWSIVRASGHALFDESVATHLTRLIASHPHVPEPPASVASQFLGRSCQIRFSGRGAH